MSDDKPMKPATINPFLAAKKAVGIHVTVLPRDVQMFAPGWSDKRASDFLDRNSEVIATIMLATASKAILGLLQQKDITDELH